MSHVHSFAPVADGDATVLILGSMPGKASLRAQQYYAFPQNAFWKIMGALYGAAFDVSYAERLAILRANRIALWDVLKSCTRTSSLDSDIVTDSIVPNDIPGLLRANPKIDRVLFNGAKAEEIFERHMREASEALRSDVEYRRMPSTSPANATMNFEMKMETWRAALVEPAAFHAR